MAEYVDIAIVGGGLVGLSCAHLLCRALPQSTVQLIEKRAISPVPAVPSFDSRSTALSMGSVELLQALQRWPAIEDQASPILNVHVSDRGHMGRVAYRSDNHNHHDRPQPLGYVVPNTVLGEALADIHYDNLQSTAATTVESLSARKQSVRLHLSDGRTVQAGLLIIADGAESALREQLGISASVDDYRQHAVIANVAFEQAHQGRAFERFTSEGPMALLPLRDSEGRGNTAALVWTRPSHQLEACLAWSDEVFLEQLQQRFSFPLGRFTKVSKRSHYPLKRILADEQVRSNIVLLGNAAHFLHPVAGQGLNLALRDVMQLVDVLTQANGRPLGDLSLLQQYVQRQDADQHRTSLISHGFNGLFSNEKINLQLVRNLGLLSLELFPLAKHSFFSQMMGRGQKQVQPHFMRVARCGVQSA